MTIDFTKSTDGLVPAIVQDAATKTVLMLGYMNQEAVDKTNQTKKVTFYSRSKNRLWTKGEESGNFLNLVAMKVDCDNDSLLITVNPVGPTCHTGTDTCWKEENNNSYGFLTELEAIITDRKDNPDNKDSYVASLYRKGINKVAQKVGEEAVEVVIEAKDNDDHLFKEESADLLFHYLILLQAKGFKLNDIVTVLKNRH
ncbi:bifunctional phosphoribosyl-AMP cyclohydrolase/phosphoribosyl-ATP diphosphatase HisIE [Cellulophaga omnivescoria]|uniref:bifunctional phosphoribosyl-AMP cyclohydrolase/phosphoribosyl-ATP diphosphatase HisIE n=1 Tax=Cellulophaga omnivescoria TaxID=1888890 RepID=UPI000984F2B7|nr:bifunctional phosphoribosyl-AMP cyclohydrolase/phosphoribosyl-ATP diphosphatase HisIE [Cellulophaga omnivescoria]WBU89126.1 bifunctional phosphoribosyl-AMP cyclohydrolase/phosphoribosyl-ATP diphosphatase HisIE [Cellulophaga omnivescoria]WKB81121.1 bifunctional phosphoribosyl-AMP cyclohydrolase/phosphoribosyl-ATP diphosphatase HisIE [Cellulophaga lytica]